MDSIVSHFTAEVVSPAYTLYSLRSDGRQKLTSISNPPSIRDMKKLTTKGRSSKNGLQLNLSLSEPDNNSLGCPHQANFVRLNQASGVISSDCVPANQDSICILSIKDSNKAHTGLKQANNSCVVLYSLENAKLEKQKNKRRELSKRILAYAEKLSW